MRARRPEPGLYYDDGASYEAAVNAYIDRLYSAAERWWQEARWKRGLAKSIMEDYVTTSQSLARVERERDEAIELLREATNSKTGMTKDCYERCLAFLTRMEQEGE